MEFSIDLFNLLIVSFFCESDLFFTYLCKPNVKRNKRSLDGLWHTIFLLVIEDAELVLE